MVGAGARPSRWHASRRRKAASSASRTSSSSRHAQILANDTLETQVQNDMSPFPPTYREHVSRRPVPEHVRARYERAYKLPKLRDLCLKIAARHFTTHILPLPPERMPRAPVPNRPWKRMREHDDYVPDDPEEMQRAPNPCPALPTDEAWHWQERNQVWLQHLPSLYMDALYELLCEYAPLAITKELLSCYVLPQVGTTPASSRVRERIFFPASLPLFSQDTKCAALLLATLAGSLALSPHASVVSSALRAIDLHGLTRLPAGAVVRLLQAPRSAPQPWHLVRVTLPGCLSIDDRTIEALVQATGSTLAHLDVTMTSVRPASLVALGRGAPRLEFLRLAWCEGFVDERVASAISDCIAQGMAAKPPMSPFRSLRTLDVSHTQMGDVALGSLCGLVGPQLTSLDVSGTQVGATGTLDVLALALGRGTPDSFSGLTHLGLQGLCLHAAALVRFLHAFLPMPGEAPRSALRSLCLDDLVEFSRRDPTSIQGRRGLSGDALFRVAQMVHAQCSAGTPWERVSVGGDKRPAWSAHHWALAERAGYSLGDTLALLMASVAHLHLGGLEILFSQLPLQHTLPFFPANVTQRCLRTWHVPATSLRDDALEALVPWTGALTDVSLDDTLITCTSLDTLVTANPALACMSLSHCRGVPLRRRRSYWADS
ncbi:hypothetical protein MNAN1_002226 [Malassezia nana]|uniref:Uncharacterized protein n=1 Tax=Malassezia nana TaxID=180528 RepID=A0AAF0EMJ8_9BASI|nr:hypothetical protein MNAN1_002226 [Malassezia nana]